MSQLAQRLQHDIDAIHNGIHGLGLQVHENLSAVVDTLLNPDPDKAYATVLADHPVNRTVDELNLACHRFIAKHLPSAGHLRFISSALRTIILIERLGDYSVTLGRESVFLDKSLQGSFKQGVQVMAYDALEMLSKALVAYDTKDLGLAQSTMKDAKVVDGDYRSAYSDLTAMDQDQVSSKDLLSRLIIISQIERVSDQAKNLCEEVQFALTGQTKIRRPYRLLFVDETDSTATQIAVALCRKYHSDRITANSAGLRPAAGLPNSVIEMCEERGLDVSGLDPSGIDAWTNEEWRTHDIVITLNQDIADFTERVPYSTSVVKWELLSDDPEDLFRSIHEKVNQLVHLVRGPQQDESGR